MIDYVPFSGVHDFVIKTKYYIWNEEARLKIAQSGYKKATEHYNTKNFWNIVIKKLFNET